MKRIEKECLAACEGYRLQYRLLSEHNKYLIQCVAFENNGRLVSQYCTNIISSNRKDASAFFQLLVDNCVFPVHIPEILYDYSIQESPYFFSA